ncbi:MAG: hypothetical protein J6S92_06645 [Oscillospiraceae bacterium]|nr:hypothetical protein [Oscillospiraceae bacterium]
MPLYRQEKGRASKHISLLTTTMSHWILTAEERYNECLEKIKHWLDGHFARLETGQYLTE